MKLTLAQIEDAITAFQGSYTEDDEYGISIEDAGEGLRCALSTLGIEIPKKRIAAAIRRYERRQARDRKAAHEKWLASLTPEQRERSSSTSFAMLLQSKFLERAFADSLNAIPMLKGRFSE